MASRMVRLKHPEGQFWDSALGFGLVRDECKPFPKKVPPDSLTARADRAGAFVDCDTAVEAEKGSAPTEDDQVEATPAGLAAARDGVIARRAEVLAEENTAAALRAVAEELGLTVKPKANKAELAAAVALAEWQREHGD